MLFYLFIVCYPATAECFVNVVFCTLSCVALNLKLSIALSFDRGYTLAKSWLWRTDSPSSGQTHLLQEDQLPAGLLLPFLSKVGGTVDMAESIRTFASEKTQGIWSQILTVPSQPSSLQGSITNGWISGANYSARVSCWEQEWELLKLHPSWLQGVMSAESE